MYIHISNLHAKLKHKNLLTISDFIHYRVIECSELTIKNGSCDPFATVTVIYSNGKQISKRTKVKKKTSSPQFNETFVFEVHYFSLLCTLF